MSLPEVSPKLKSKVNLYRTNFLSSIDHLVDEINVFKETMDGFFSDLMYQSVDVEDRLKNVLKEKKLLLIEYELLRRKEKEESHKYSLLEEKLKKESRKLKQYEIKMKNIASLLTVNTANTEANHMHLKSTLPSSEQSQDTQSRPGVKQEEPLAKIRPEAEIRADSQARVKPGSDSKILVHENEDDEFFDSTLRRKTPDNATAVMEIPETICDDFVQYDKAKTVLKENSPIETPSKKRKLCERSPEQVTSPTSLRPQHQQFNQITSPLRIRNQAITVLKQVNPIADASPSLITKPKKSQEETNRVQDLAKPRSQNEPRVQDLAKLRIQDPKLRVQESQDATQLRTQDLVKLRVQEATNRAANCDAVKEDRVGARMSDVDNINGDRNGSSVAEAGDLSEIYEVDTEPSKRVSQHDETRFPLLEKMDDSDDQSDSASGKPTKQTAIRSKRLNASKLYENIEFSDDSDDFVDTKPKSKTKEKDSKEKSNSKDSNSRESKEKSKENETISKKTTSKVAETSFAFTKPADTSRSQWKLKVGCSGNKSKLKQTKLAMERKVGKIDITEVAGYNGGVTATSSEKRLIIEETQVEDDTTEDEEDTRTQNSHVSGIRVRSMTQLTLPDESMFQPNAVSTQKTKCQSKTNSCKQSLNKNNSPRKSTRQSPKKTRSPRKTATTSKIRSPGKTRSTDSARSPGKTRSTNDARSPVKANCVTPNQTSSTTNARSSTKSASGSARKPLFLPKECKGTKEDFSSKWSCQECIDYFIDGYGPQILKIRPPPKKCGHGGKYPATPPDFWVPMCD